MEIEFLELLFNKAWDNRIRFFRLPGEKIMIKRNRRDNFYYKGRGEIQ